ncbi:hypothetical protein ACFVGN_32070 [Streptomyces sp. NPDC057757]|uniref:hypothetical protein n=1 Tax=Streptomyces sp. NPDC057757 TaxID=3346241 RepID=UPI0036AFBF58
MENVPPVAHALEETTPAEPAQRHVDIARQLLADTDSLDYAEATDRDLCRLIGRCEVVIASLILAIEDGTQ